MSVNGMFPVPLGQPASYPTLHGDQRVQLILQTIQCDPARDIAELARRVNLSSSRLSHLFKLETHHSLQSFLTNCRLEKAAELLLCTETPVKEISYSIGYCHPPSFVRAFRSRFGCSPKDYRNRQRVRLKDS
jgi:AraC-like DNA-binding protein